MVGKEAVAEHRRRQVACLPAHAGATGWLAEEDADLQDAGLRNGMPSAYIMQGNGIRQSWTEEKSGQRRYKEASLMQSDATTVAQYLAELPADRRAAIEAVRQIIAWLWSALTSISPR